MVERLQVPAMENIWEQIRYRPQYVLLKFNVLDYCIQFKRGHFNPITTLRLWTAVDQATRKSPRQKFYSVVLTK
jgi:hypothetical protein